jgi:nicotinamide-nucleotide amidase
MLNDLNRGQAMQPAKAEYVHNAIGTAPGMLFWTEKGQAVVSMPGVPAEMKRMMTDTVIPCLVATYTPPPILHRIVKTIGIAEAVLAERIADWEDALPSNISLAYLPNFGQVRLRLTATGLAQEEAARLLDEEVEKLLPQIADYVYATEERDLEAVIGNMLVEAGATLATAESCTGGFIAQMLTSVPGSSAYFMGGVVAYDNAVKVGLLGVDPDLIAAHGAVSEPVAAAMAMGIRERLGTTYAVSTTGIAGPTGATPDKPVGLVYMALAGPEGVQSFRFQLLTERDLNIRMASLWALNLLRKKLAGIPL